MNATDIENVAAFVRGLQELTANLGVAIEGGYDGYARLVDSADGESLMRIDYRDDDYVVEAPE